jgi:hypothetical protein
MHVLLGGIEVYKIPIDDTEIYDGGDPVIFKYTNNFPSYTPSVIISKLYLFIRATTKSTSSSSRTLSTSPVLESSLIYDPQRKNKNPIQ